MSTLRTLSDALSAAIRLAAGSTVQVHGRRRASTGIVWAPERVLTAAHTLHRDEGLTVTGPDGLTLDAQIVGVDLQTDLALLAVPGATWAAATWSAPTALAVGAVALPLGRGSSGLRTVFGIVAELGPAWHTAHGARIDAWIDVDAALPPGFSGGPLVDADGAVVGLNTSALTPRGAVLPHATVARIAERLQARGTVPPGYLGVGFQPVTFTDEASRTLAGRDDALLAVSVEPGGPGATADVRVGDVLIQFDGQQVTGIRHLLGMLGASGQGASVALGLLRGGVRTDLVITLGARPSRRA